MIKGYKALNKDLTCRGFQFEIGKTYKHKGDVQLCRSGFHFCLNLVDCFSYYKYKDSVICEIEAEEVSEETTDDSKRVCRTIKIVRILEPNEFLHTCNSGKYNTGIGNIGHYNSGSHNCGNHNSGEYNSGNSNSGDSNAGRENSGSGNSGNINSGHHNSGSSNAGNYNSGHFNSGSYNSGNYNSGEHNSGSYNSGYLCNNNGPLYFCDQIVKCDRQYIKNICSLLLLDEKIKRSSQRFKEAWNRSNDRLKEKILNIEGLNKEELMRWMET